MKKITFCFITIFLILISGMIGLAQGLPSLTESSPTPPPPPPTPPTTNVTPPPVPETSSNAINIFSYADPSCNFSFNFPNNWKEYKEVEGTLKAELDFWEEGYLLASFFCICEGYGFIFISICYARRRMDDESSKYTRL